MRVGVTGADGFTGRYLVAALTARGHEAMAITSDVGDAAVLCDEIAGIAPDAVAHLAAIAFVHSDDYAGFYGVNQVGSFNLLDGLRRAAPGCIVLLASSAQVYGPGASGLVDEDHTVAPANHYALSKLAMEIGARFFSETLRPIVVRPFNYTGVGQEARYLVPKIVDHFRCRASTIELGNIDVRRDFGDVRAVVEAYVRLLETPSAAGVAAGPLNVSTGAAHSVREVVAIAERLTGHRIDVSVNPAFVRAGDVELLAGNPGRLAATIPGWAPRTLEDTIGWMLDEGESENKLS